ncbi:MAG TPA: GspH/FimT family pseudopilin [Ramlibacter sp.]|nr:GspH/FimT family pseudopilin [Ramlibacter sp.]
MRGFTLVELTIVLAIASVLLGAGIPSFNNFIRSVKLTSTTNDFFSGILIARSEAAKRRSRVAMCKSTDGVICTATGGWDQGWIVFHDTNNDGSRQAGEEVVWQTQAIGKDMRVLGNLNVARYVSYTPTGEAKLVGGGFQAGTITLCNVSVTSENAREIVISSSGRPRVQKTHIANCV